MTKKKMKATKAKKAQAKKAIPQTKLDRFLGK